MEVHAALNILQTGKTADDSVGCARHDKLQQAVRNKLLKQNLSELRQLPSKSEGVTTPPGPPLNTLGGVGGSASPELPSPPANI